MTIAVVPNEFNIFSDLRRFIVDNVANIDVIRGQANRVPEPKTPNFVVLTALRKERIETNVDTYADVCFTGSIAVNGTLTVESVFYGTLQLGSVIFGVDVPNGTYITKLGTGSGSVGTYTVSKASDIPSRTLAAGTLAMLQPVEVTIQVDVHGPNDGVNNVPNSADIAHQISTMLRDEYATTAFRSYGHDVTPLYADNPKQIPFINAEKQYEDRWVLEACLQANQAVINIPQQFFDKVVVGLIEVDSHYPP